MSVVINTNVDSLNIQNNLAKATSKLSTSMKRMSTGLKVISAKDDAAGTVIAAKMQVQLDGNQICQQNVQNGNAMLSTMEGNLDVVEENLVRIRDLTLQAKNGTYSKEEIAAMQDEVSQRMAEIDRLSNSSKYSQLSLFEDADLQKNGVTFQVGANSSDDNTIAVDKSLFDSVKFEKLTGRDGQTVKHGDEVLSKETADVADESYVYITCDGKITADTEGAIALCKYTAPAEEGAEPTYDDENIVYALKVAKGDVAADGKYTLGEEEITASTIIGKTTTDSYVTATKNDGLDLTALDAKGFAQAVDDLDDAIDNITARKSKIGSAQNRFDSALSTLETQYENLSSAKSIITDADIAAEASNFTQQQILQQVSTSLLAQANQAPSIALSLI